MATHSISVQRPDLSGTAERFEAESFGTVASGVRAVIGTTRGGEEIVGRDLGIVEATLTADPCDLQVHDRVVDQTAQAWEVLWVQDRPGLGLNHVTAGLRRTEGA